MNSSWGGGETSRSKPDDPWIYDVSQASLQESQLYSYFVTQFIGSSEPNILKTAVNNVKNYFNNIMNKYENDKKILIGENYGKSGEEIQRHMRSILPELNDISRMVTEMNRLKNLWVRELEKDIARIYISQKNKSISSETNSYFNRMTDKNSTVSQISSAKALFPGKPYENKFLPKINQNFSDKSNETNISSAKANYLKTEPNHTYKPQPIDSFIYDDSSSDDSDCEDQDYYLLKQELKMRWRDRVKTRDFQQFSDSLEISSDSDDEYSNTGQSTVFKSNCTSNENSPEEIQNKSHITEVLPEKYSENPYIPEYSSDLMDSFGDFNQNIISTVDSSEKICYICYELAFPLTTQVIYCDFDEKHLAHHSCVSNECNKTIFRSMPCPCEICPGILRLNSNKNYQTLNDYSEISPNIEEEPIDVLSPETTGQKLKSIVNFDKDSDKTEHPSIFAGFLVNLTEVFFENVCFSGLKRTLDLSKFNSESPSKRQKISFPPSQLKEHPKEMIDYEREQISKTNDLTRIPNKSTDNSIENTINTGRCLEFTGEKLIFDKSELLIPLLTEQQVNFVDSSGLSNCEPVYFHKNLLVPVKHSGQQYNIEEIPEIMKQISTEQTIKLMNIIKETKRSVKTHKIHKIFSVYHNKNTVSPEKFWNVNNSCFDIIKNPNIFGYSPVKSKYILCEPTKNNVQLILSKDFKKILNFKLISPKKSFRYNVFFENITLFVKQKFEKYHILRHLTGNFNNSQNKFNNNFFRTISSGKFHRFSNLYRFSRNKTFRYNVLLENISLFIMMKFEKDRSVSRTKFINYLHKC